MKHSYHFSVGGDHGEHRVGFCARINAQSPEEAAAILKARIGYEYEVSKQSDLWEEGEYLAFYPNVDSISVDDIDEVDDEEDDNEEEDDLDGAFLCEECRTGIPTDDYRILSKDPRYKGNVYIVHDICIKEGEQVLNRSGTLLLVQEKEA